ncbi:STM3941 family protein [Xanthomonas sp. XNM01]|uniref:STM3941 family protein n=1 Tax=Xanthomonas sp. XNM01 TaxID=2769289 RepID=UPI001783367E|nr:STM3941 family protein [Xanthomonas sp. XNM01]MBD9370683.1 hypothetical protein [Xanthomonas sp. XNM01]
MQMQVIRSSRVRYALLLLLSLPFVAIGALLLKRDPASLVGWANVLFFGASALVFAWQVVDPQPRLVFSDQGVLDRTLGVGLIPWAEIDGAYLASMNGNRFLCLELRDPERWVGKLGRVQRALVAGNVALGFTPISLNLSCIVGDPLTIQAHVLAMAAASRDRGDR